MSTTHSLSNRLVVVTGGASGIGLATVHKLLSLGALLSICDINEAAIPRLRSSLPAGEASENNVYLQMVDVTSRSSVSEFLQSTQSHFPNHEIAGIASIAGTGGHRLGHDEIWQTTDDEYEHIMDSNVRGTFNVLSESLNPQAGMLAEKEEGGSSVICVGSMFSQRGYKNGAVFSASKMVHSTRYDPASVSIQL